MGKMNCQQCRKWWSPYLDSELDASTTFEVAEHLCACPGCRERLEREAFFENWLRDKLRADAMPDEIWGALCREVRGERRPLRFPFGKVLAVAASVVLVATAALYSWRWLGGDADTASPIAPPVITVQQSVSDILQDRAPTLVAFSDAPAPDFDEQLATLSRKLLHAVVAIAPEKSGGHAIDLISVTEQRDASGEPYLEVRLNCCGRPLLLALAKRESHNCIAELRNPTGCREKKSRDGCPKAPPIKTESIEREDVMIAAATADHYLTGVLASISVTPLRR